MPATGAEPSMLDHTRKDQDQEADGEGRMAAGNFIALSLGKIR